MSDPELSPVVLALVEAAERHPDIASFFHDYSARRRSALVDAVQDGIDDGELPPHLDAELTALALSSPLFCRRLMTDQPVPSDRVDELVATVLGSDGG